VTSTDATPLADADPAGDRPTRLTLRLDPDRLLPSDPGVRALARAFYDSTRSLPIVSPHGHVDANVLAHDISFGDAAGLLITPDHYVTRLLHEMLSHLGEVGRRTPDADAAALETELAFERRVREYARPGRIFV